MQSLLPQIKRLRWPISFACSVLLALSLMVAFVPAAHALTDIETGAAGTNGSDGAAGNPTGENGTGG
jgi:hypothetical protein